MKKYYHYIPNAITISRIFITPLLYFFLSESSYEFIIIYRVLFIYFFLSDFLDGYLARRWKVESQWGALLDPIADKIGIWTAYFLFYIKCGIINFFFLVLYGLKELLLMGGSLYYILCKKENNKNIQLRTKS